MDVLRAYDLMLKRNTYMFIIGLLSQNFELSKYEIIIVIVDPYVFLKQSVTDLRQNFLYPQCIPESRLPLV